MKGFARCMNADNSSPPSVAEATYGGQSPLKVAKETPKEIAISLDGLFPLLKIDIPKMQILINSILKRFAFGPFDPYCVPLRR